MLDLYTSDYGKLPKPLTDCVKESYTGKTSLKGVAGQDLYYVKAKGDLNSYYGMTAQDPLQLDTLFDEDDPDNLWSECTDDPEGSYNDHCPHLFCRTSGACGPRPTRASASRLHNGQQAKWRVL